MKECSKCKATKPIEDFNRRRKSKDGRDGQCARCKRGKRRKWIDSHPGAEEKYRRSWALKNPGKASLNMRKWRAAHPERAREINRKASLKRHGGRKPGKLNEDRAVELVVRYLKLPRTRGRIVLGGLKGLAREYGITAEHTYALGSGRKRPGILRQAIACLNGEAN